MTAQSGQVLHGVYEAADDGQLSDAENVLFYNVGSQHFRHVMLTGVRFERAYAAPVAPFDSTATKWSADVPFAAFHDIRVASIAKAGAVWAALRTRAEPPNRTVSSPSRFVLRLIVTRPPAWPGLNRSAAGLIKALLDGIISAYHAHAEPTIPSRAQAGGAGLGHLNDLPDRLLDARWAALGLCTLWRPLGGARIQWNPADDYCVAAEIILADRLTTGGWELSGHLAHATAPS